MRFTLPNVSATSLASALLASVAGAQSGGPILPGTGEGLELLTGLNGAGLDAVELKAAAAGSLLDVRLTSANAALDGAVALLGYGVAPLGGVPVGSLPGLAIDLTQPSGSFVLGPLAVDAPADFQAVLPATLVGRSLVLQGLALPVATPEVVANGLFAASDGRRLDFDAPPQVQVVNEDYRLLPADTGPGDNFGFDVALTGGLVAVSAPFDNVVSPDSGSAYVFDLDSGALIRQFLSPTFGFNDNYGRGIALRGTSIAIGNPGENFSSQLSGVIYTFNAVTGQGQGLLAPVGSGPTSTVGFNLGDSIDAADRFLVAGSRGDTLLANGGGSAHVFDAATGAFVRRLFPDDPAPADNFGSDVATAGDLVLVGSPFDDGLANETGSAYLFDGGTGEQLFKFIPQDVGPDDLLGLTVELDEQLAMVGGPLWNGPGGVLNSGVVDLYDVQSGAFVARLQSPTPGISGGFGEGLGLTADYLLVGESFGQNSAGVSTGVIHVYDRQTLERTAVLEASDGLLEDALGETVAVEGNRVVAGARGVDEAGDLAGAAYVFTLPAAD